MDSCRDRLHKSTPPEGPTDRQYDGIPLQALTAAHENNIRKVYLERRDFGLANFQRTIVVIYADNLSRRSITSAGIGDPSAALKGMNRKLSDVQFHNCSMFGHNRRNYPNHLKQQYQSGQHHQQPNGRQRTRFW